MGGGSLGLYEGPSLDIETQTFRTNIDRLIP